MVKNSQGFTLAELMIVIAIIGIMALIIAPNIATGLPTYRIKAATSDCLVQLRNARHRAIKEKRDVEVFFDTDKNALQIDDRRLPVKGSFDTQYGSGVGFGSGDATEGLNGTTIPGDGIDFNDDSFTFTARGLADFGAGTANNAVYFTNNQGASYAIRVNAAGALVLFRWRGRGWSQ